MSEVFDLPVRRHYQVIEQQGSIQRFDTVAINAAVHAINTHDNLVKQNEALKDLIRDADDYLNINELTSIGSGGILHRAFKEALKDDE